MSPLVVASQLATGLGVLAGAILVKSAIDQSAELPPTDGGWRRRRCPSCDGSGRVSCLCARWSDGDVGCRTCAGSGRMSCSSCGGSGTGRPLPIQDKTPAMPIASPRCRIRGNFQKFYHSSYFKCRHLMRRRGPGHHRAMETAVGSFRAWLKVAYLTSSAGSTTDRRSDGRQTFTALLPAV